jgi:DNA-binding response OmpR family regulator
VVAVSNGKDAQQMIESASPPVDAVVLDLMLPDLDGLQVLREMRARHFEQPVLIVTARDAVEDRVAGLDAGADDYLVKPFSFAELVARLRALFRRSTRARSPLLHVLDLELDLYSRRVARAGREVQLTQRQFDLLAFLMQHPHETVTRDMIARGVWRETTATWTNVIDVQINQIRKKVERPDLPAIVHTIRGEGYLVGVRP